MASSGDVRALRALLVTVSLEEVYHLNPHVGSAVKGRTCCSGDRLSLNRQAFMEGGRRARAYGLGENGLRWISYATCCFPYYLSGVSRHAAVT